MKFELKNSIYQTMEGFGASGAWWAQDVGGIDGVRDEIAALLYSKTDGIGISTYRYNLGGGSKNSGSSKFHNANRAAECFLTNEGTYDFSRDKNAVYMLKKCVEAGCDEVVLFVNSPPELYTKNHKSCLDTPWTTNLAKKNVDKFAAYCVEVAEHFVSEGIPVKFISPVNEPVWVWTERHGQEGCHYNPHGVRLVMRTLSRAIEKSNILNGKVFISGAENGDIRWFNKTYTRIILGDKLIKNHVDGIDVHSYFLPLPFPSFFNDRVGFMRRWRRYLDRRFPNEKVRISEWTHMKGGRDSGMESALVQARVMYEDISILNAVSWQHWIAVSDVDYCDGLIYINPDNTYDITKRFYAFGNFSKFVERGAQRIGVTCENDTLLALGFKKDEKITLVLINEGDYEVTADLSALGQIGTAFVTDENSSLERHEFYGALTVTPKSVTTVIFSSEVTK